MQIAIDRVSNVKQGQYGPQSTIHSGSDFYYVNSDASEYVGKTVEAEVVEKQGRNGKQFKIAKILKVVADKPLANGATQPWSEWEKMAATAHALAKILEADQLNDGGDVIIDRSRARMAFVATVLIAFSNGKIGTEADEPIPF